MNDNSQQNDQRDWSRNTGLLDQRSVTGVTVIGVGHIGSWVTTLMSQMTGGPNRQAMDGTTSREADDGLRTRTASTPGSQTDWLHVWDGDEIGRENLSASYYFPHQVGTHKGIALETNIRDLNRVRIVPHMVNYTGQVPIHSEVVILAVDSLNERRSIFESIMDNSPDVLFLIDIRVGGTLIEVFTVHLDDDDEADEYRETLDYIPAPLPCGMKAFAPVAFIAAGLCCSILRNYWMDEKTSIPKEARFDILTFWNEFTFGG